MSNKIPKELYNAIYEFYETHLEQGVAVTKISELFNAHFGTNFAESSLRNRYEFQRDLENASSDLLERVTEIEKAERKLALQEMQLVSEQKKIQRKRSAIDSAIRYNADKELVAEVFNEVKDEFQPETLPTVLIDREFVGVPIFNTSDIHLGYEEKGYYTLEEAKQKLSRFFQYVSEEITSRKLSEVIISDTGDQIEGSSLRVHQLSTIAEEMSKQAVIFAELYTAGLKKLSQQHPNTHFNVFFVDEDNHSQIRLHGAKRGDTKEMFAKVIANDIRRTIEVAQEYNGMTNIEFTHAGEILTVVSGKQVWFTHGHQYPKDPKRLSQKLFDIHNGQRPDVIIHGHYHTYQLTTGNVVDGFMQTVVSCPAVVGDTAYGKEGLGLTGVSGFVEINVEERLANVKFIEL